MNKLFELEKKYYSGSVAKQDYISKMHGLHRNLWDYSSFIKGKNILSITIMAGQIILETKEGIKMICDPSDERIVPVEIINFGDYERKELEMMRNFIGLKSVILDIGSNIGWYSLNYSRLAKKGLIFAYEPVPKTFKYLKENIELNGTKNIAPFNFGLSDVNKTLTFYYDPGLSGSTSMRRLHEDRKKIKIKCKVKRLDDIKLRTKRIDFIKCDIEGAEIFAIKGGLKTIDRHKPVLFLEMLRKWAKKFGYHPNDIIKIMNKIGYLCFFARKTKLIPLKKITDNTLATNFYFLHSKKHAKFIKELVKK